MIEENISAASCEDSEVADDSPPTGQSASVSAAHVVLLVNFVAPNMRGVFQEISRRVGRLTILSSVAVESNRQWNADWGELDVVVQRTWTITRHPKHPGGYRDVNYIHLPLDTIRRLKRLRPDVIVSLELGARTVLSLRSIESSIPTARISLRSTLPSGARRGEAVYGNDCGNDCCRVPIG